MAMAAVWKSVRLYAPPGLAVRHRSKPNIQKPRLPFWERLKCLETTKPIFLPDPRPQHEQCELVATSVKEDKLTKFETLLGKQMLKYLDDSPLVGIYHANSIKGRDKSAVVKLLLRNNMRMGIYNRFIVRETLKTTKYAALLPLFVSHTMMVFSKTPDVHLLLSMQKKMPQYILLAGIFENRIMSKPDLDWYASLPPLEMMRSQLYSTLNTLSSQLVNHLGYHQKQLSVSLDTLSKEKGTDLKSSDE